MSYEGKKKEKKPCVCVGVCYTTLMARQSNLYKFTVVEFQQNPPSLGGNWECGTDTRVSMSRSPKKALAFEGALSGHFEGVVGCPVLRQQVFSKGDRVLWEKWD